MDESTHQLLAPSLPGSWIILYQRIWQMDFLNPHQLAKFSYDRGLPFHNEQDIIRLWQLGLIKADLITSRSKLRLAGIVSLSTDRFGRYLYIDERNTPKRIRQWDNALKKLHSCSLGFELLFHPFRYFVLHHLHRVLGVHISAMQMLLQEGFSQVLNANLLAFNRWSASTEFRTCIRKWNDIASLCIITEPYTYERIFRSLKYSVSEVESDLTGTQEICQHIQDYWQNDVKPLLLTIGRKPLEEIRRDLDFDTRQLDPNVWVHTMLRLGEGMPRLKAEGRLGGALLLHTMNEMLRRASEDVFNAELGEEDELKTGRMQHIKETLYGSRRILDNHVAANNFVRYYGLNYKPRIHFYVEGNTEYGAITYFLKAIGVPIPITNLHGLIKATEGKQMVTFFRDRLQSDIQDQVYSIVLIDGDLLDNVKIVANHARINQTSERSRMFGQLFLANIDFEYENFTVEELEEVFWEWVRKHTNEIPHQADRNLLHTHVKDAVESAIFFKGVKYTSQSLSQLVGYEKGEEWGAELMNFALNNPMKSHNSNKRQILEILEKALFWETTASLEPYEKSIKRWMLNPQNGELIPRITS